MKSTLYKAAVLFLLAALVGAVGFFGWPHYLKYAENSTLQSVGRHSLEVDAVEVLRLTDTGKTGPAGSYVVRYDHSPRGVAARHALTGSQAAELVRLWGRVRFAKGYIAACHEPGFVLRFLAGRRTIFEAAVCFDCENVSWQSVPFFTSCRQMSPTVADPNSGADNLKVFLTQLAPPQPSPADVITVEILIHRARDTANGVILAGPRLTAESGKQAVYDIGGLRLVAWPTSNGDGTVTIRTVLYELADTKKPDIIACPDTTVVDGGSVTNQIGPYKFTFSPKIQRKRP